MTTLITAAKEIGGGGGGSVGGLVKYTKIIF